MMCIKQALGHQKWMKCREWISISRIFYNVSLRIIKITQNQCPLNE